MHRMQKTIALMLIAVGALVAGITQAQQRTAEAALRAAVEIEMTRGVNAAIDQYKRVAETYGRSDPATAAQALLRLASAFEKTGSQEAMAVYVRIVKEFGNQRDAVSAARSRLNSQGNGSASTTPPGPLMQRVWAPSGYDQVSVDGRYMPYPDWSIKGMGIHDLVTGTDRLLHTGEVGETIVISPDNSQIVYQYFTGNTPGAPKPGHYVLRLVSLTPNAKPRDLMRNSPSQYIEPVGWTPDGKQVLVIQQAEDKIWQIAMVSVASGTSRVLKSLKWGMPGARISPDGRYVAYSTPVEGSATQNDIFIVAADGSTHAVVVDHPANDYRMVWSSDGSKLLFISLRTGTPSLWMIPVKEGKPAGGAELVKANFDSRLLGMSRDGRLYYLSGTSGQNIYRAEVDPDGKVSKAPVVATDSFVNVNRGGQISRDGKSIAYYSYRPQPVIVVKSLLTGEERVVAAPSLNVRSAYFLGPRWFADGQSVLVDATENDRPDVHHYRVDLATGRAEEIMRGLFGEQFTPGPFGNVVYYRGREGLMRHDLDTGLSTRIAPPELFAMQFTVSADDKQVAFMTVVDSMKVYYVIPTTGGEPREVYRLPDCGCADRFNALEWSPDQKYLLFVVEDEGISPLGKERNSLWRVKVEDGAAERLGVTMSGRFKGPYLHPNGKQLFFTSIQTVSELWAMENFLPGTPKR